MASSSRRAVITGVGVVSPIGMGVDAYWQGLQAGKSGVRRLSVFDPSTLPTQIVGEIPDFDPKNFASEDFAKVQLIDD